MSMTSEGLQLRSEITLETSATPVADALKVFNEAFDYDLTTPILPEHVRTAAELADAYGRPEIAKQLRAALAGDLQSNPEVGE